VGGGVGDKHCSKKTKRALDSEWFVQNLDSTFRVLPNSNLHPTKTKN